MNVKYIKTIFAAFLLCMALCACGGKEVPQNADIIPETSVQETDNTAEAAEEPAEQTKAPQLRITELMASNKAAWADDEGQFPDWAELNNYGSENLDLSAFTLRCGDGEFALPETKLKAGDYCAFFCGDKDGEFRLPANGGELVLLDAAGNVCDRVSYPGLDADQSYALSESGFEITAFPTPGFENSDKGYDAFAESCETPAVSINEVCVYNRIKAAPDGKYYDWVEILNSGEETIDLEGWSLSDSGSDRGKYVFPKVRLKPGQNYVVFCDDELETGFGLNTQRDELYLCDADGRLVDYVSLHDIPVWGSCGRMSGENGFFYFPAASCGKENSGGMRRVSGEVSADTRGGVYENTDSVKVTLSAEGEIYYTLDGSMPTEESLHYTEPVLIDKTCVLRAVSVENGRLPGAATECSFIMNEGHTLPVASLIIDPKDYSGKTGMLASPTETLERPGCISFFEGDDSFTIDCGVRLHGATSRINMTKKSFKLTFREVYDGELDYDLFENGVTEYSSVLLRAAQESSFSTNMRDIVWHELAQQCEPALSTQDYKYCVLYINGRYNGIYAFREAHSTDHYARHYGYDEDKVEMWQGVWDKDSDFAKLFSFVKYNDMSIDENYEKVAEHIDLDALAAWTIIESFSGNIDINSPNVRFYYTHEDEMLHYALVDLDLSFFTAGLFPNAVELDYGFSILVRSLLVNEHFRALMIERMHEYLTGPLNKDNIQLVVRGLAEELRPEIERDGEMWGYTVGQWEREIDRYMIQFTENYGYSVYESMFASSAKEILHMSSAEYEAVFGDLPK